MKKIILCSIATALFVSNHAQPRQVKNSTALPATVTMSKAKLEDKIKGGWAGQTIGVTYGGPTEFKYNGTLIQDYTPIRWYDGYLKKTMEEWPGLYDDIYMDLTFVEVIERLGMDAPVDSFASAFAHADYRLWHANQAARYNILNGMKSPASGHWSHNPHADDIDYQIEADYAGLMSPGMPNAASTMSDKVGHIMNYGDGWYGGIYVGAMYSLAFVSDDIQFVVKEALKTIPAKSRFYQCMSDVIRWHKQYPNDWKQAWFELQKKWSSDLHCPKGVYVPFNIDASINSAYVLLGLLYGNGDYTKTLEIATRCGQDSDCNPSTAGGVLGTMLGYDKIPDAWKAGLKEVEDIDFKYTKTSLNKVYAISFKHALERIVANKGKVTDQNVMIAVQAPQAVRFEQSFPNIYPFAKYDIEAKDDQTISFEFEGTGFVVNGTATKRVNQPENSVTATLFIDDKEVETATFPTDFITRKLEVFYKYDLPKGKHKVRITVKTPGQGYELKATDYILYTDASQVP